MRQHGWQQAEKQDAGGCGALAVTVETPKIDSATGEPKKWQDPKARQAQESRVMFGKDCQSFAPDIGPAG
jgi:hypothetical protein